LRLLTNTEFSQFITARRVAVLHFDAEWNLHRTTARQKMLDAQVALSDQVNFAEVDCDSESDLARSIPVLNVPCIAYYLDGQLVAALIGANQNIHSRIERLLRGETIDSKMARTQPDV